MIRQLQKRFIRITVLVLTIAMVLVVAIVNITNLITVRNELSDTLHLIAESAEPGDLPDNEVLPEETGESGQNERRRGSETLNEPKYLSKRLGDRSRHDRNMVLESSWFMAMYDNDGIIRGVDLSGAADTDEDTARSLAEEALAAGKSTGYIGDYLFLVRDSKHGTQVFVMNCETRLASVRTLALISGIACLGGVLLALLLVSLASRRAVQPTIRNMEQQKQFITNASHELKTPLTVISTNMELVNMEAPDNPWVRSTQKQVSAMKHLVDELVYLSRMEEEHPAMAMEQINLGALLEETAEPFTAMAEFNGRSMTVRAEKDLAVSGDRPSLQRLISTLCDNAAKYTPEGGSIIAEAAADGRYAVLRVSNTVETPLTKEQCAQLFNRFYRTDPSRNKEKQGGFGIGLSIAAAITEKHGGTIRAAMDGDILVLTCILPRDKNA